MLLVGVVASVALVVIPTALGREVSYWGYNNLTANNPAAGTCPGAASGVACSTKGNWDESDADWNSGQGSFAVGFICQSDGLLHGRLLYGNETPQTYGAWWSTYCPTHYNRAAVAHVDPSFYGTYNYLRARVQIWP